MNSAKQDAKPGAASSKLQSSKVSQRVGNSSSNVQGGAWKIMLDGKNVTPRSLMPGVPRDSVEDLEKKEEEAPSEEDPEEQEQKVQTQTVTRERDAKLEKEKKEKENREFLSEVHEIILQETSTLTLLSLPSLCVPIEPHEVHTAVTMQNKAYEMLCESKAASDQFKGQHTQTLNNPQKMKDVLAAPAPSESVGCNASQWDIFDTFEKPPVSKADQLQAACEKSVAQTVAQCLRKPGCLLRFEDKKGGGKEPSGKVTPALSGTKSPGLSTTSKPSHRESPLDPREDGTPDAQSPDVEDEDPLPWKVGTENGIVEELLKPLRIMERIVSQNTFHKQHMIYRDYPTLEEMNKLERRSPHGAKRTDDEEKEEEEPEESSDPRLQDLFCFESPQLTQGLTVTDADWNRSNQDLLAVSYGDTGPVQSHTEGLVLFWSLKNPTYPERVLRTKQGVTCLDFSSVHLNLIAAGLHDGSVCMWDLRKPQDTPVLESGSSVSTHNDRKHTDVVWENKWVDRGQDKVPRSFLASVSSDGKVLQWSMKKGLEQTQLMQLKRVPNPNLGSNSVHGHKEGIVFRQSSGFCIDFPKGDPSVYLIGTEDGLIHKCSTSYNEQYLETYYGHSAPVYKVRCNPFLPSAFLSCSADWTIKLWSTKQLAGMPSIDAPLQNYQSTDLMDAVNDVYWSPKNSTSFAAAMDDGRVELWDLKKKPLDPVCVHYPRGLQGRVRRTCVRFSTNSPVLVAGDANGSVDVMRMYNCDVEMFSEAEQQERLLQCTTKKR